MAIYAACKSTTGTGAASTRIVYFASLYFTYVLILYRARPAEGAGTFAHSPSPKVPARLSAHHRPRRKRKEKKAGGGESGMFSAPLFTTGQLLLAKALKSQLDVQTEPVVPAMTSPRTNQPASSVHVPGRIRLTLPCSNKGLVIETSQLTCRIDQLPS